MSILLATEIITRAAVLLLDDTHVRWPLWEKTMWLDDGQFEIVLWKPDANVKNVAYQLVAGTKQSIPDGSASFTDPSGTTLTEGLELFDVVRNMGTAGTTPGRAIRLVDRSILDATSPDWHSSTAAAEAKHWSYDERDPKQFYVYPPQPTSSQNYVEVAYAAVPAKVDKNEDFEVTSTARISLPDIYANVLLDYILYRAYQKDADFSANSERMQVHYNAFVQALGARDSQEKANNPNVIDPARSPSVKG